ncbi:MAG: hypothetical protein WC659_04960 [Patescibacteria group bacterium]
MPTPLDCTIRSLSMRERHPVAFPSVEDVRQLMTLDEHLEILLCLEII